MSCNCNSTRDALVSGNGTASVGIPVLPIAGILSPQVHRSIALSAGQSSTGTAQASLPATADAQQAAQAEIFSGQKATSPAVPAISTKSKNRNTLSLLMAGGLALLTAF